MDKIKEFVNQNIKNPLVTALLGFLVGLILGLPILGWGPLAVKWTDAAAMHLRADARVDYLRMAVDSYARTPNKELAMMRWAELGDEAASALESLQKEAGADNKALTAFSNLVKASKGAPDGAPTLAPSGAAEATSAPAPKETAQAPAAAATTPETTERKPVNILVLGVIFFVLVLVLAGLAVLFLVLRRKNNSTILDENEMSEDELGENQPVAVQGVSEISSVQRRSIDSLEASPAPAPSASGEAPIRQFTTTYTLGDDLYDDSFSIDTPTQDFLGECGVGISDTIGIGDPKKVSAFEVWLFDKNDIQTVTKVFMSEHIYNDPEARSRLAAKGEPVLTVPGTPILLETATLQMEVRVVDLSYGQGALPPNSYFERMMLDLSIWPKPAA